MRTHLSLPHPSRGKHIAILGKDQIRINTCLRQQQTGASPESDSCTPDEAVWPAFMYAIGKGVAADAGTAQAIQWMRRKSCVWLDCDTTGDQSWHIDMPLEYHTWLLEQ